MKYKLISLIFLALIFCFPPLLGCIMKTFTRIYSLEFKGAPVSLIGDMFLRYTSPVITSTIMTFIHVKNKEINSFALFVVGIIVGFTLSYVVMVLEQYGYIILFSLIALTIIFILLNIFFYNANKRKKNKKYNC